MTSEEFLKKIGARRLTDEEAKELHLLRIAEGKVGGFKGLVDAMNEDFADKK